MEELAAAEEDASASDLAAAIVADVGEATMEESADLRSSSSSLGAGDELLGKADEDDEDEEARALAACTCTFVSGLRPSLPALLASFVRMPGFFLAPLLPPTPPPP